MEYLLTWNTVLLGILSWNNDLKCIFSDMEYFRTLTILAGILILTWYTYILGILICNSYLEYLLGIHTWNTYKHEILT